MLRVRPPMAPRRVRPNCTHIDMDRFYTREEHCFVCGHVPSIGFLYICHQDVNIHSQSEAQIGSGSDYNEINTVDPKSQLRQELEDIGLSESVIVNAERGGYSAAQLDRLKTQKLELKQTISDTIQRSQINAAQAHLSDALTKSLSHTDGSYDSKPQKESMPPACNFRACHTCRPYYKDRIYQSIEAIASNSVPALTPWEASFLPTKSAQTMRLIGLLPNPPPSQAQDLSQSYTSNFLSSADISTDVSSDQEVEMTPSRNSVLTFKTTQTDIDAISAMRRPRKRFYNLGTRSSESIGRDLASMSIFSRGGIKAAIQSIFRPSRASGSEMSSITLPVRRTGTARDLTVGEGGERVGEFDVGSLRRVRRQKERADMRRGNFAGGFEGLPHPNNIISFDQRNLDEESEESSATVYSCASEGSEVEVRNGVALTEEAVETHTPDILKLPSTSEPQIENAQGKSPCVGDDTSAMSPLESILTQV